MTSARSLLIEIVRDPELVASISDDQPLALAGVNSGDIVRLTLALEEILGYALPEETVENLRTLTDIDILLAGSGQAGG